MTIERFRLSAQMSKTQLWWAYFALGGNATPQTLDGFLNGQTAMAAHDYDLVVQALNDYFVSQGSDHPVPYSDELPVGPPGKLNWDGEQA
jgi:hypothetical protein